MSLNDRAREAAAVLRHGGTLPDPQTRHTLIGMLDDAADGLGTYLDVRTFASAVADTNPDLHRRVVDGELPGLYETEPVGTEHVTPLVERVRGAVEAAMIEHGPDGHIDGSEEITRAALEVAFDVDEDEIARAIYETAPGYRGAYGTWSYDDLKAGWSEKPYPDYPHLYDDLLHLAEAIRAALLGDDQ